MPEKVKIEITKEDGTKIRIEVPSNNPELIYTYLKALESVNSSSNLTDIDPKNIELRDSSDKVIEKVEEIIKNDFGLTVFTLSDLYRVYKLKYNEDIPKSTLSTYLNRLVEYGLLSREGRRGRYRYQLRPVR